MTFKALSVDKKEEKSKQSNIPTLRSQEEEDSVKETEKEQSTPKERKLKENGLLETKRMVY